MMLRRILVAAEGVAVFLSSLAAACGDSGSDSDTCYGPVDKVEYVRHVKRMQPGALNATYGPKAPLEWGQINFLHTTDTHGWLEGHLREKNYGADWGDFASFSRQMKQKAADLDVDLLLIDTGDLHDGAGLTDATEPGGVASMPIFDAIDYDLLAIGNHELYQSEIAYQMFNDYARRWGDKYVTSNVKVLNQATGEYEYVGATHRYFTTAKGLRIMAFGVLFDFTGNSNVSQIIKAEDMIKESWFQAVLNTSDPIDLFVLLGHNPVRYTDPTSTFKTVFDAIRAVHLKTPIQIFGGHRHIRDFAVYDDASVAIGSGRFCETLGWLSMSGFDANKCGYNGTTTARDVSAPWRPAKSGSASPFVYSRRYLDWNRKTFAYHSGEERGDPYGNCVSRHITKVRGALDVDQVYGCAPQDWCLSCVPLDDDKSIFTGVIYPAMSATVDDKTRANRSRAIFGNVRSVRFDVHKGPFTSNDAFTVLPFANKFMYLPDVPFRRASTILERLNENRKIKRDIVSMPIPDDECTNPTLGYLSRRDLHQRRGVFRRQESVLPGYVTTDDWGTDGDDTQHLGIPHLDLPSYWETRGSFPDDGSDPDTVDVIYDDFIQSVMMEALGPDYNASMAQCYMGCEFTTKDAISTYVQTAWQDNKGNCPIL